MTATGGNITCFLASGLAASKPTAPAAQSSTLSFYYATDTTTLYMYDWNAAAWVTRGNATGANPTATASDTAVNVSSANFMRADAAPAVQKGSSSQFGVLKVDGTTLVTASGVASVGSYSDIAFVIDGGGSTITTGMKGYLFIDFACTISQVTQLADQSGSIVTNIYACSYANFDAGSTHPVVADKITASAPPTISTATKSQDSTLTGWTTSIAAGTVLAFNVDSVTTVQRNTITLRVKKT